MGLMSGGSQVCEDDGDGLRVMEDRDRLGFKSKRIWDLGVELVEGLGLGLMGQKRIRGRR